MIRQATLCCFSVTGSSALLLSTCSRSSNVRDRRLLLVISQAKADVTRTKTHASNMKWGQCSPFHHVGNQVIDKKY